VNPQARGGAAHPYAAALLGSGVRELVRPPDCCQRQRIVVTSACADLNYALTFPRANKHLAGGGTVRGTL
jgi:hypothetical protein